MGDGTNERKKEKTHSDCGWTRFLLAMLFAGNNHMVCLPYLSEFDRENFVRRTREKKCSKQFIYERARDISLFGAQRKRGGIHANARSYDGPHNHVPVARNVPDLCMCVCELREQLFIQNNWTIDAGAEMIKVRPHTRECGSCDLHFMRLKIAGIWCEHFRLTRPWISWKIASISEWMIASISDTKPSQANYHLPSPEDV